MQVWFSEEITPGWQGLGAASQGEHRKVEMPDGAIPRMVSAMPFRTAGDDNHQDWCI